MPVQATIAITPGAGQFLDAVSMTIGANLVVRETMVLADPTSPTELAAVSGGALAVFLPTAQITTLTPPTASAIGTAVAGALANPLPVSGTISVSGTVGVTQSTSPWVVSLASTTITGTVSVTQGTSPWVVSNGGTFAVQASITTLGQQLAAASVPVVLTATQLSTLTPLTSVAVTQSTSPWVVSNAGTFAVQATLAAETTKVIGTIRATGNVGGVFDAVLGAAIPANAVQVGGSDGTDLRALATDTTGNQKIRPAAPTTASWSQLAINCSSLGANIIVPAVGGQTIRVMRMFFINCDPTTTVNVTIQDTTPTSFTGPMRYISTGNFNGVSGQGEPLYVSATGQGIQLLTDAAVQLSGTVWFTQS